MWAWGWYQVSLSQKVKVKVQLQVIIFVTRVQVTCLESTPLVVVGLNQFTKVRKIVTYQLH
jgi:hypothetical protein